MCIRDSCKNFNLCLVQFFLLKCGDLFFDLLSLLFAVMEDRLIEFSDFFIVVIDSHVKPPFCREAA